MMEELFFLEAIIVKVFTINDFFFSHPAFWGTLTHGFDGLVAVVLIYIFNGKC